MHLAFYNPALNTALWGTPAKPGREAAGARRASHAIGFLSTSLGLRCGWKHLEKLLDLLVHWAVKGSALTLHCPISASAGRVWTPLLAKALEVIRAQCRVCSCLRMVWRTCGWTLDCPQYRQNETLAFYSNLGDLQREVAEDNFNSYPSALPRTFIAVSGTVIYTESSYFSAFREKSQDSLSQGVCNLIRERKNSVPNWSRHLCE